MKLIDVTILRTALADQSGQVLPWVALTLVAMLGMAGLTIDVGRAYVVRSQLQNSTNAAALAAAGEVFNTSSTSNATAFAQQYSSGATGNQNYSAALGTVSTTVTPRCLSMLMPPGVSCTGAPNNAVVVRQNANVPTSFMRLFGVNSLAVSTTATASMQGQSQAWNVAIIVDSTGSMNVGDSNCGGVTEYQCALQGVQSLLAATNPACPPGSSQCPTGANFRVGLFTFPNVSTDTVHMDIDCSGHPTALPYTFPLPSATSYTPLTYTQTASPHTTWTATYEVTYNASDADANGFLSNYYAPNSTSTGGLNASSSLVKAVGYGGSSGRTGCMTYSQGIVNSGIGNTYFAGAIYAAQSALLAEQAANPGSKNAIIYLSDGQANAFRNQFPDNTTANSAVGCNSGTYSGSQYSLYTCGTSTASQTGGVYLTPATVSASLGYSATGANGAGIYPDWQDQCQQAIVAAHYAATYPGAPTTVYAVAYGAENTGCTNGWSVGLTDTTYVARGAYNVSVSIPGLIPCTTVEDIASSLQTFYSDYQQSGSQVDRNCVDDSHTVTSLSEIFQSIAASFTTPRLLPNDAT